MFVPDPGHADDWVQSRGSMRDRDALLATRVPAALPVDPKAIGCLKFGIASGREVRAFIEIMKNYFCPSLLFLMRAILLLACTKLCSFAAPAANSIHQSWQRVRDDVYLQET